VRGLVVALLASATCLGAAAPRPVHAQTIDPPPLGAGLSPSQILAIVRSTGFEPAGRPVRRAGVYVVWAIDSYDQDVDVTVDAASGRIVTVRRAALGPTVWGGYVPSPPPRYGASRPQRAVLPRPYIYGPPGSRLSDTAGFEDATGALPLPPRGIPGAKASRLAPPLPRPRPTDMAAAPPVPARQAPSPESAPAAAGSITAAPTSPANAARLPAPAKPDIPPVTPLE